MPAFHARPLPGARSTVGRGSVRQRRLSLSPPAQRAAILALFIILCCGFFRQAPGWNENSRYDLVVALVDHHTTRIDPYIRNTGDRAFYHGHYYSDKAPGSAFLVVPTYLLIRGAAALAGGGRPDDAEMLRAATFTASALPTVVLALLLLQFLRPLVREWWALTMALGYALGTLAFPFSTLYFGHTASACLLFAAFYVLWRTRADGPTWQPILAGFLVGWAVLVEFTALLGAVPLLIYGLARSRRVLLFMGAGALPPAMLLLSYNWVSFGAPLHFGYSRETNQRFAVAMNRGLFGATWPRPLVLHDILLGPRGLLRLSPWLAIAPTGLFAVRRHQVRREVLLCAAIVLAFLLFNAGYYLPLGGWSPGPRFLIPALPFATVLVALAPRAVRAPVALLVALSIVLLCVVTATMPLAPDVVHDPVGELWLPHLIARDIVDTTAWLRWGLPGTQPLAVLALAAALALATLCATASTAPALRWATCAGGAALATLTLSLGTPIDLIGAWGALTGHGPPGTRGTSRIAIVDTGITPVPPGCAPRWCVGALPAHAETGRAAIPAADTRPVVAPWAQAFDGGGAAANTMVVFSIYSASYGASGARVWSAWYSHVNWQSDERTRLRVWWSTAGMAPGTYRLSVAVLSADRKVTLTRVENAGTIYVPAASAHAGAPSSRVCRCIVGRERRRASSTTT